MPVLGDQVERGAQRIFARAVRNHNDRRRVPFLARPRTQASRVLRASGRRFRARCAAPPSEWLWLRLRLAGRKRKAGCNIRLHASASVRGCDFQASPRQDERRPHMTARDIDNVACNGRSGRVRSCPRSGQDNEAREVAFDRDAIQDAVNAGKRARLGDHRRRDPRLYAAAGLDRHGKKLMR